MRGARGSNSCNRFEGLRTRNVGPRSIFRRRKYIFIYISTYGVFPKLQVQAEIEEQLGLKRNILKFFFFTIFKLITYLIERA